MKKTMNKRSNKQRQKGGFVQEFVYSTTDFFKGLNAGFAGVPPAPSSSVTDQPYLKGGCTSCKMMGGRKRQTKKRQTKKRVRFADSRR
jgi:hypothetical protein